jgi:hypothetical protein
VNAAITAEVGLSDPAIAKGSELRNPITNAPIEAERSVTAIPWPSQCDKGPEKIREA